MPTGALKSLLRPIEFDEDMTLPAAAWRALSRAGHILGAAIDRIGSGAAPAIVFSGDIGRYDDPMMPDPVTPTARRLSADRIDLWRPQARHAAMPKTCWPTSSARPCIAAARCIVPAFAVGRAQSLIYHLARLKAAGRLPEILPVFLDSPMAIDASEIFRRHADDQKLSPASTQAIWAAMSRYVRTARGIQGADRQPDGQSHHLGERHGDRRARAASSGALCARSHERDPVRRLPGRRHARRGHGRRRPEPSRCMAPMSRCAPRCTISPCCRPMPTPTSCMRWAARLHDAPPRPTFIVHGEPAGRRRAAPCAGGRASLELRACRSIARRSSFHDPARQNHQARTRARLWASTPIPKPSSSCARTARSAASEGFTAHNRVR